jgi:hypothetical protein
VLITFWHNMDLTSIFSRDSQRNSISLSLGTDSYPLYEENDDFTTQGYGLDVGIPANDNLTSLVGGHCIDTPGPPYALSLTTNSSVPLIDNGLRSLTIADGKHQADDGNNGGTEQDPIPNSINGQPAHPVLAEVGKWKRSVPNAMPSGARSATECKKWYIHKAHRELEKFDAALSGQTPSSFKDQDPESRDDGNPPSFCQPPKTP